MVNKVKIQYYCGSQDVIEGKSTWANDGSLEDAIQHASDLLDEKKTLSRVYIVKVVKVVSRQQAPVIVEDVL